jgi:agmatine deiminase
MVSVTRLPAEWEPQSGVQITWPHDPAIWGAHFEEVQCCFRNLVEAISHFEPVLVVCKSKQWVESQFADCHFRFPVHLVELPSNDVWTRDHGAITVMTQKGPAPLNFFFNGWGLKFPAQYDNQLTAALAKAGLFGDLPLLTMDLVLEGGSIDSDGDGTLLTTTTCLLSPNRNPHLTKSDISEKLLTYLGARRLLWLEHGYLAGDDTDAHIDMLARFCNPSTIAFTTCTDPEDEHFTGLSAMEAELRAFRQPGGDPYQLVPLPLATVFNTEGARLPASYTNFLIVNGAVLVPQYGQPEDQIALERLRPCFPGRELVPLQCQVLIAQGGSLHCATMQFPAHVLRIS